MKKSRLIISLSFIVVCCVMIACPSCNNRNEQNDANPDDTSPGKILSGLPAFPNATPVNGQEPAFKPFSTPLSPQVEGRPPKVEYETASAWYEVESDVEKILNWYRNKLTGKDYQKYTEMMYNSPNENLLVNGSFEIHTMGFYHPALPEISIEVHVSDVPDNQYFVILVNHEITGAFDPPEPPLPEDIDRITVSHSGYNGNPPKQEIITDSGDVRKIVGIINDLPLLPDAPIVPVEDVFTMVIHSASQGDIELLCDMTLNDYPMIRIRGRTSLKDDRSHLLKAVNRLLDID
jgi:hypothetical protein